MTGIPFSKFCIKRRLFSADNHLLAVEGSFPCLGFTFKENMLSIFGSVVVQEERLVRELDSKVKIAYTHLASVLCDAVDRMQLARVLHKLRKGLDRLASLYEKEGCDLMIYPSVTSFKDDESVEHSFQYTECYRRMTFKAKAEGETEAIVVKFSDFRYGANVQRYLSDFLLHPNCLVLYRSMREKS